MDSPYVYSCRLPGCPPTSQPDYGSQHRKSDSLGAACDKQLLAAGPPRQPYGHQLDGRGLLAMLATQAAEHYKNAFAGRDTSKSVTGASTKTAV